MAQYTDGTTIPVAPATPAEVLEIEEMHIGLRTELSEHEINLIWEIALARARAGTVLRMALKDAIAELIDLKSALNGNHKDEFAVERRFLPKVKFAITGELTPECALKSLQVKATDASILEHLRDQKKHSQ